MGEGKQPLKQEDEEEEGVVPVNPRPSKGILSAAVDLLEKVIIYFGHDKSKPYHYLSGPFAPADETPPCRDLPVRGYLPSSRDEDNEEALKRAFLEKLPTYDRLQKGIPTCAASEIQEVDYQGLGFEERKSLLEKAG